MEDRVPHKNSSLRHLFTKEVLEQAYINDGLSTVVIGRQYGVAHQTIRKYLMQFGIPLRGQGGRKYSFTDSSGFLNPVDDWHAYWIGFLAADGVIWSSPHGERLQVHLSQKDAHLLHELARGIKSENPISFNSNQGHPSATIAINDKYLVSALAQWGVTQGKTYTLGWPDKLPEHLIPAYIRGFFDGDGTIYQRHRVQPNTQWTETVCRFISGSTAFLSRLEQELQMYGIKTIKRYQNQSSNAHVLPLSGKRENLSRFAELIYKDCTICLERKKEVFSKL